jgi:hypothetical protein
VYVLCEVHTGNEETLKELSNVVNTDGSTAIAKINTCFAARIKKWLIKVGM